MRRPGGQLFSFDGDGIRQEVDTITCNHCNDVVQVRAKLDDIGGFCRQCMKPICAGCVDKGCTPFEGKLDAAEKREIALRSYGFF